MRSLSRSVSTVSSRLALKGGEITSQQWWGEWREQVTLTEDPPKSVQCPKWSGHSPGQVRGSPERKGLETKAREGPRKNWGQKADVTTVTQLRLQSGSPRHLLLLSETINDNPAASPHGPMSSCRPIPIEWLVTTAWILKPPCLIPVGKHSWPNYSDPGDNNILILTVDYIKYYKSYLEYVKRFQRAVWKKR